MVTGLLLAVALAAPDAAPEPPSAAEAIAWLVEPASAIEYVLGAEPAALPSPPAPPPQWDGTLGEAALRAFYGSYRTVLASQDDAPCGFVPSCSAFSEQAIDRFGLVEGVLLTADRLLRDHPLSLQLYPTDAATGLLIDPPSQYSGERGR